MIQTIVFFLMNGVEVLMPLLKQVFKKIKMSVKFGKSKEKEQTIEYSVLITDCGKEAFDNEISNEYLEMITQFGLIFTFGAA